MTIQEILQQAINAGASDVHITVASPPVMRVDGQLVRMNEEKLIPIQTKDLVLSIMTREQIEEFERKGELDFSFAIQNIGRFRVNVYKQRASYSMVLRIVGLEVPKMEDLHLPPVIKDLCMKRRGLILVTGPTGSGKSTTLAAMINYMNEHRNEHVITIEDPIEFLHKHNRSIVNQREIGTDTDSFAEALRAALRQDPDVILVGEMRDLETISTAITAAETGHLVLSTLHTLGAAKTIDRIIDVFPPAQQQQIRVQLGSVIEAVVSQQIIPKADGSGRVAAFEVMIGSTAIKNLIRDNKSHQMDTAIQTGSKYGMQSMDASLIDLYRSRTIDRDTLHKFAIDRDMILRQVGYQ